MFLQLSLIAQEPDQLWLRTFGGSNYDHFYSGCITSDGGYICVGETSSFGVGRSNIFLVRKDKDGNLIWQKTFGDGGVNNGIYVQETSDGGFIITGGGFGGNAFLLKTDNDGDEIWTQVLRRGRDTK